MDDKISTDWGIKWSEYLEQYGPYDTGSKLDDKGMALYTAEQLEMMDAVIIMACETGDFGDSDISNGIMQAYRGITRSHNRDICGFEDYYFSPFEEVDDD